MRLFGSLFDSERLMRELRRSKLLLHSHHASEHEIVVVSRHILRALELRVHLANEIFHIANHELFGEKRASSPGSRSSCVLEPEITDAAPGMDSSSRRTISAAGAIASSASTSSSCMAIWPWMSRCHTVCANAPAYAKPIEGSLAHSDRKSRSMRRRSFARRQCDFGRARRGRRCTSRCPRRLELTGPRVEASFSTTAFTSSCKQSAI